MMGPVVIGGQDNQIVPRVQLFQEGKQSIPFSKAGVTAAVDAKA
jgi:hypothetical protein